MLIYNAIKAHKECQKDRTATPPQECYQIWSFIADIFAVHTSQVYAQASPTRNAAARHGKGTDQDGQFNWMHTRDSSN